jgi:hypothetical protein
MIGSSSLLTSAIEATDPARGTSALNPVVAPLCDQWFAAYLTSILTVQYATRYAALRKNSHFVVELQGASITVIATGALVPSPRRISLPRSYGHHADKVFAVDR